MDVRDFFDAKASGWARKYGSGGALVGRLAAFGGRLGQLRPPPARVLDFGCGTGNLSRHLARSGYDVDACDVSAAMIAEARRLDGGSVRWSVLGGETAALPYADAAFDAVVASSVLEYVPDLERVLVELARVTRPGGVLLVTVPDPRDRVRRVEAVLRRVAALGPVARLARASRRAAAYVEYLRLSRNRFDAAEWARRAERAGLAVAGSGVEAARGPLMLLAFRRETR